MLKCDGIFAILMFYHFLYQSFADMYIFNVSNQEFHPDSLC